MSVTEYRQEEASRAYAKSGAKPSVIKKPLTADQRLQESEQRYIKIMSATMKAQTPDEPAKAGEMAQLYAAMESTSATLKSVGLLEKIHSSLSSHEMTKALPFHGKEVQYNTSVKHFDGESPVQFQYQLRYNDQSRPSGAHISTLVTILDKRGLEVRKARGETKNGVHTFQWDGRNNKGKLLEEGEYSIKVESNWERMVNGVLEKKPIEAGAFISGHVDAVEMRGGKAHLIIDGVAVDVDKIIKVEDDGVKTPELKLSDYSSYIGQTAEIEDNGLVVDAKGFASLSYKCELERPGKLSVQIFNDKNELVGVAVVSDIKKGLNNIRFKASNALTEADAEKFAAGEGDFTILPPGDFHYKLSLQDRLDTAPEKYSPVSITRSVAITGLDFSEDPVVIAGEERFAIDKIKRLKAASSRGDVFKEAVQYLGKYADISLNQLELRGGAADAQFFRIPVFEGEGYYGRAYLEIFDDSGRKVASIEKDPRAMMIDDGTGFYNIDNLFNFLRDEDKYRICVDNGIDPAVYTIEAVSAGMVHYFPPENRARIFNEFKDAVVEEYSAKTACLADDAYVRLYSDDYAALSETDKELVKLAIDKNKRYTGFRWDGKGFDGKRAPDGSYRYELRIEKYHTKPDTAEAVLELELVPDRESVKIVEYTAENGDLKFIGRRVRDDGTLDAANIVFSRDEIVKLSA